MEENSPPTKPPAERLHVVVEGRVQGVGFRAFVIENATRLGVAGWVRNRWDETVEVVAEGSRADLEKLLRLLGNGPRASYVTGVRTEWGQASGEFHRFQARPTV